MPLFMTLAGGKMIITRGERIPRFKPWRRIFRTASLSGNQVFIRKSAIMFIEHVPDEVYRQAVERAKEEQEKNPGAAERRIARPQFTIPKKVN